MIVSSSDGVVIPDFKMPSMGFFQALYLLSGRETLIILKPQIHPRTVLTSATPDSAESFAKAVNMEREKGDELFVPGSVKILSVGSWKADEFYEGEVESGMEVVLEISIHNDKAILPGPNEKNAQKGAAKATDQVKHFITGPEHASCSESDIYRLSRNALHVHQEMERPKQSGPLDHGNLSRHRHCPG